MGELEPPLVSAAAVNHLDGRTGHHDMAKAASDSANAHMPTRTSRSSSPADDTFSLRATSASHLPSPLLTPPNRPSKTPAALPTIPSDSETSSLASSASSEGHPDNAKGSSSEGSLGGDIPEDTMTEGAGHESRGKKTTSPVRGVMGSDGVRRLSVASMQELADPEALPIGPAPERKLVDHLLEARTPTLAERLQSIRDPMQERHVFASETSGDERASPHRAQRPTIVTRPTSTPPTSRNPQDSPPVSSPRRNSFNPTAARPPPSLNLASEPSVLRPLVIDEPPRPAPPHAPAPAPAPPLPLPTLVPLPPMSLHTHLQLELAGQRPSPLYIHHSHTSDISYESSAIKFERLKSVLLLPSYLERTLSFGALACLDAWLYTFTILPIRFVIAVGILARWWGYVLAKESRWLVGFVWYGLGRLWERARASGDGKENTGHRKRRSSPVTPVAVGIAPPRSPGPGKISIQEPHPNLTTHQPHPHRNSQSARGLRHRRTASQPSNLSSFNKADLLQGGLILVTSMALMRLDASRMYHFIRAQSAIKLYVIYNVLEVGDRLLSALGQDILECLFSSETLSRTSSGRSKVLLPFGMFLLSLAYSVIHSVALYYQVITLNVAVNSYSNALLTLLLSNQFVEIKGTVFKRIEKDNLFQLTCADIVERFQLWIMLLIIAFRNIVEVGGLSVPGAGLGGASAEVDSGPAPLHSPSILPHSFTVLPSWLWAGVLSPFLIVVFSEVIVDTIKHAYVTKFNNIKPAFYSRILDIICKDYYTNAFSTPSLTRRLGLAVIPMSCLFIRSSIQTYHMFLATNLPAPLPESTLTSLAASSATPSSAPFLAVLDRFDMLLRDSLGRSVYSHPYAAAGRFRSWWSWTTDDLVAALAMFIFFSVLFLVLLMAKLVLGMVLLRYARNRYAGMKVKEHLIANAKDDKASYDANGRRVGAYAQIEITDGTKCWINADPREGLKKPPKMDATAPPGSGGVGAGGGDYTGTGVERFEMVAKRIW